MNTGRFLVTCASRLTRLSSAFLTSKIPFSRKSLAKYDGYNKIFETATMLKLYNLPLLKNKNSTASHRIFKG